MLVIFSSIIFVVEKFSSKGNLFIFWYNTVSELFIRLQRKKIVLLPE